MPLNRIPMDMVEGLMSNLADITKYNAKQQGVKGDGTTDDAPALNALIQTINTNGGGVLYLPTGTYRLNSQLNWYSNVSLIGDGWGKSILKPYGIGLGGAIGMPSSSYSSNANPYMNCHFEKFEIDGSNYTDTKGSITDKGIYIQYLRLCSFKDLYIHDTVGTGLGADFLDQVVIDNVITYNCGRERNVSGTTTTGGQSGIGIGTGWLDNEKFIITNCQSIKSGNYGIFIERQDPNAPYTPGNVIMDNCIVRDGGNRGFGISSGSNITISNCQSFNNANEGIAMIYDCTNIKIHDNTVYGNGHGIYVGDLTGYTKDTIMITNNLVYNNTLDGIHFESGYATTKKNYIVNNNLIYGNSNGISFNGVQLLLNVTINDNKVYLNKAFGINLSSQITNLTLSKNEVFNNGQAGSNRTGIQFNENFTNPYISNNICYDSQATITQARGIYLTSPYGITGGTIQNNICYNQTYNIVFDGSLTGVSIDVDVYKKGKSVFTNNGYIQLPSDVGYFTSGQDFMIETKVFLTSLNSPCFVSKRDTTDTADATPSGWDLRTDTSGKIVIEGYQTNGGTQNYKKGTTSLALNTYYWIRLSFTNSTTTFTLSISTDGVNYTTDTWSISGGTDANLRSSMAINSPTNTYISQNYQGTSGNTGYMGTNSEMHELKIWKGSTNPTVNPTNTYVFKTFGVNQMVLDIVAGENGWSRNGVNQVVA